MEESVDKQLQISFDGGTITNKEIPSEQFSLTESLSSDGLMFGSCEASEVKFRIYNVFTPLKDKWLTVTQVLDKDFDNPLQIGKYKVYSDKPTADRSYRDVVAYDSMFDIINADVAGWYNSLTFPMQLKTFRDSFFDYFGIEQEEVALVNDAMTVEKTIEPSVLSGKDVLQSICQINGCFGHIGRDGKMQYVFLNAIMGGLYPSNNIYPADDLYPMQANINVLSKGLYVEPPTYEDYTVKPIDKLEIREKEGDIGVIVGSGNNAYVVEDNFLVYGKSTDDLTVIANNMLSVIDGLEYRPFESRLVGNPCFEVGDMVRLNTKHQIIDSYVLQRTLSGVQCLRDDFSAEGEEYQSEKVNDIHTDIKQLKGKSNTLERTIEETRSTIANVEEGLQSEISQTADAIRLEVADNTGKISTIEQTVDSISLEVADNTGKISTIEQTVDSVTQRVEDVNQGLSAEIETNANQIVLGVNSQGKMVLVELSADRNTGTAFSVNADNINLSAEEVINLLSNGNINLSGKNISISSNNFTVDSQGNMKCNNADVTGKVNATELLATGSLSVADGNLSYDESDGLVANGLTAYNGVNIVGSAQIVDGSFAFYLSAPVASDTYLRVGASSDMDEKMEDYLYVDKALRTYGALQVNNNLYFKGHTISSSDSEMTFKNSYGTFMFIRTSGVDYLRPTSDNASNSSLGSDNIRWENIYVAAGGIHNSDKRLKNTICCISDKYEKMFSLLNPCTYIFNDKSRTHIGFISQEVESAMTECGLTDLEFAGFCKDKKTKEIIDEDGNVSIEYVYDENGEHEYIYSLRYSEFIALNTHMIQKAYKKIETQQQEIEELKKSVSFLMSKLGDDSNG